MCESGGVSADNPWRAWLTGEHAVWARALPATLDDAVEHLQSLIFEDGWAEIRATTASDEAALRLSVQLYEARLTDVLRFPRVVGALATPVAWSQLKAELRRAASAANLDLTL